MLSNKAWNKIFRDYGIDNHDFDKGPFELTTKQVKKSCQSFTETADKESRILCKQDTRSDRPTVFVEEGLFILPSMKLIQPALLTDINSHFGIN